jgi:uncharacterized DUF497 family protein
LRAASAGAADSRRGAVAPGKVLSFIASEAHIRWRLRAVSPANQSARLRRPNDNGVPNLFFVSRLLTDRYFRITVNSMAKRLTWDENKRRSNLVKHGLNFADLTGFDAESALFGEDIRGQTDPSFAYPERRFFALGMLRGNLVVVIYAEEQDGWRVISLRPASRKERKLWQSV